MPANEMEDRRSGLQVYLSALSWLKESWRSSIVTDVLCAEQEGTSTAVSPATDQVRGIRRWPRSVLCVVLDVVPWLRLDRS